MTINFYQYGSDIIAIETCCAGHGPMRVGTGRTQVAAIDDLEGTPIEGHLHDALGLRWLLSQMQDSETDADELELLEDEDKSDVSDWETVTTFVYTFEDGTDKPGACDAEVQIGRSGGGWYIQSKDDAGGSDYCDDTTYETEELARDAAEEFAFENHEAEEGEDAEKYLARQLEETAGEPCDDGEYCVYWATALDDEHVVARYETSEQAEAAAEIKNKGLHEHNPGCGYEVRQLVSDDGHMKWVAVEA